MTDPAAEFTALLPALIMEAAYEEPSFMIRGSDWSLSAMCSWRWVSADGEVCSPAQSGAVDRVWDLIGERVTEVSWSGPANLGLDPTFRLESGGQITLLSDASFDTWVLDTPNMVFVGPMADR